jgi:hypothetical protein
VSSSNFLVSLIACLRFSLSLTHSHLDAVANTFLFLSTKHTGWPEEFMTSAIAHCRDNKGTKCPAAKYFVNIDDNVLEQRVVAMPADTLLPDEVISPVRVLPQGQCPPMKPVGAFATVNHKAWAWSSSNDTASSTDDTNNDDHYDDDEAVDDATDDDKCSSCGGTFFIICWFINCLIKWLFQ